MENIKIIYSKNKNNNEFVNKRNIADFKPNYSSSLYNASNENGFYEKKKFEKVHNGRQNYLKNLNLKNRIKKENVSHLKFIARPSLYKNSQKKTSLVISSIANNIKNPKPKTSKVSQIGEKKAKILQKAQTREESKLGSRKSDHIFQRRGVVLLNTSPSKNKFHSTSAIKKENYFEAIDMNNFYNVNTGFSHMFGGFMTKDRNTLHVSKSN